ncbi:hypothetical protein FPRO03_01728 [Fusarium proliferatum]|nr:hypothetical protein FPRO03_01728 [Fusarium proliferatum]
MYRQGARDAIGAAENALLLAELVKSLITPGVTADQHEKARSILTSMGDLKGLTASLNIIVADHATESESPQLGLPIQRHPIPIDLTGSLSARKRRATQLVDLESDEDLAQFEEAADRTRDGIPTTPRPLPAMGGTKGLTTGLDMIIGEQFPELAPSSIDSVLRAAHAGRSGSASNTSKKFNDKPIPIDLTGSSSSWKRQAPDHDEDEDLLGALNAPTTTPTQALPPWKLLDKKNGNEWVQIISAEEARTLRWEDYDAIDQAPQVSEG